MNFPAVMRRVRAAIAAIEPVDSPAALREAGVHVLEGRAQFVGPQAVTVDGAVHRFRRALLPTGAEPGLPMRWYPPKTDVRMDALRPTDKATHCPYKGQAEYWTISVGGPELRNAVWSYRTPLPESERIAGHLSFWPERSERLAVFVDGLPI